MDDVNLQGDSGGPLHVEKNGVHQEVGKFSFKLNGLSNLRDTRAQLGKLSDVKEHL